MILDLICHHPKILMGFSDITSLLLGIYAKTDLIQTKSRIRTIRSEKVTGHLLGGNMMVLSAMLGSNYLPSWKGAILFSEEVGAYYYQIDKMLS